MILQFQLASGMSNAFTFSSSNFFIVLERSLSSTLRSLFLERLEQSLHVVSDSGRCMFQHEFCVLQLQIF